MTDDKLMFLEQFEVWVQEQRTSGEVSKSTASNRASTFHKMEAFMQTEGIPDFDILEYDFTVQRSATERMTRGKHIKDFFLKFRDYLDTVEVLQNSTINQHRNNLLTFLSWEKFQMIGLSIPVPDFFKTKVRPKDRVVSLTPDQVEQILRLPNTASANINLKLAIISCWRASDLAALKVGDVEMDKNGQQYWITRMQKKTKRIVSTPIPFRLMSKIFSYYGHDPSDPCLNDKHLINFDTKCAAGDPRTRRLAHDIRKGFATAFGAGAVIKTISFNGETVQINLAEFLRPTHLARRSGATYYASMGMPLETIAALFTGHDDIKTLREFYIDPVTQRMTLQKDFAFNDRMQMLYGYNEVVTGTTGRREAKILQQMAEEIGE